MMLKSGFCRRTKSLSSTLSGSFNKSGHGEEKGGQTHLRSVLHPSNITAEAIQKNLYQDITPLIFDDMMWILKESTLVIRLDHSCLFPTRFGALPMWPECRT